MRSIREMYRQRKTVSERFARRIVLSMCGATPVLFLIGVLFGQAAYSAASFTFLCMVAVALLKEWPRSWR